MILKELPPNTIGKDYVVGDLHGCWCLLMRELENIGFDFEKDRLFSVGDLVDRGKENLGCISLIEEKWFFPIRGNHEQMLLDAYEGCYRFQTNPMSLYIRNGGGWFFDITLDQQKYAYSLVKTLPYILETIVDGYKIGFIHANPPSKWEDVEIDLDDRLWFRTKIQSLNESVVNGIDHIFLGHTPLQEVKTLGNCTYIDTGAVFGNKLSIICINDFIKAESE